MRVKKKAVEWVEITGGGARGNNGTVKASLGDNINLNSRIAY